MAFDKKNLTAVVTIMMLSGCSFASNALFPSLSGSKAQEEDVSMISIPLSESEKLSQPLFSDPPKMGTTDFNPSGVSSGKVTGTFVGQKVITFRQELGLLQKTIRLRNAELQGIRNKAAEDIRRYHEVVAFINARLQVGTTPGNPKLATKWQDAQNYLEFINRNISMMNQLASQVASDSAMTSYLLDSIRAAYNVSGSIEEDHEQLRILEDETNQTSVLIERLLSELNDDIRRQQEYANSERNNQNTLSLAIKDGKLYGSPLNVSGSVVNREISMPQPQQAVQQGSSLPMAAIGSRKPILVIRFHKPNVSYEQPLYQAVKQSLDRYPDATFDLVAVTPAGQHNVTGLASRRHAESVLRSLTSMGLPATHIRISAMSSASASVNEVHLYLK